jgi:hypothetical protein
MPINYKEYPKNWLTEIRPAILARAGNCCEFCGVANGVEGWRGNDGKFYTFLEVENALERYGYDLFENALKRHIDKDGRAKRMTKIVLTIAHLNHDKENHDVAYETLAALCQGCHLKYDLKRHMEKARLNRDKKKGQLRLEF